MLCVRWRRPTRFFSPSARGSVTQVQQFQSNMFVALESIGAPSFLLFAARARDKFAKGGWKRHRPQEPCNTSELKASTSARLKLLGNLQASVFLFTACGTTISSSISPATRNKTKVPDGQRVKIIWRAELQIFPNSACNHPAIILGLRGYFVRSSK